MRRHTLVILSFLLTGAINAWNGDRSFDADENKLIYEKREKLADAAINCKADAIDNIFNDEVLTIYMKMAIFGKASKKYKNKSALALLMGRSKYGPDSADCWNTLEKLLSHGANFQEIPTEIILRQIEKRRKTNTSNNPSLKKFALSGLHRAAEIGHSFIAQAFVSHSPEVRRACLNSYLNNKPAPIILAINHKQEKIVKILLSQEGIELEQASKIIFSCDVPAIIELVEQKLIEKNLVIDPLLNKIITAMKISIKSFEKAFNEIQDQDLKTKVLLEAYALWKKSSDFRSDIISAKILNHIVSQGTSIAILSEEQLRAHNSYCAKNKQGNTLLQSAIHANCEALKNEACLLSDSETMQSFSTQGLESEAGSSIK